MRSTGHVLRRHRYSGSRHLVIPTTLTLVLMASCGTDVAVDREPSASTIVEPDALHDALEAGLQQDWDAMVRQSNVRVGAVDETATTDRLSEAVAAVIDAGWSWMTTADLRSACLCETTVTDQGVILEDGTLDATFDDRPAWLLVYDDVLLPMTEAPQTVLVIIDPLSGAAQVRDLPEAPVD